MKKRLLPVFTSLVLIFAVVIALVFVPFEASSDGQDSDHLLSKNTSSVSDSNNAQSILNESEDGDESADEGSDGSDEDLGKDEEFRPSKRAELI